MRYLLAAVTVTLLAQSAPPPPAAPPGPAAAAPAADVTSYGAAMIGAPPASLNLDPFYKKYADAFGIPVVGSEQVDDAAVLMARDIVNYMLAKRPDVRANLVQRGSRLLIMAAEEQQTDLPEYRTMRKPAKEDPRLTPRERENYDRPGGIGSQTDQEYWNRRARGMGGVRTSCAEENLLGFVPTADRRFRYYGEHICVHEFSHGIMSALREVDPALMKDLQAAYASAKAAGLFKGHYAENTIAEYWAEGTQWWFWSNYAWQKPDGAGELWSPEDLKAYDPTLFEILSRVYLGHRIPADIYHGRKVQRGRGSLGAAPLARQATVNRAVAFDVSGRLAPEPAWIVDGPVTAVQGRGAPIVIPTIAAPAGSAAVEQTAHGTKPGPVLVDRFDGLGVGFDGPHGPGRFRNPSDNSLAVGPNHIVQTVNSQMAIFTKKGGQFDASGRALYGAVPTNNVFKGFGGTCEARNNGDAVVRYDQLADRWLIVMPIFSRIPYRDDQPAATTPKDPPAVSVAGVRGQPGPAARLFVPPPPPPPDPAAAARSGQPPRGQGAGRGAGQGPQGAYAMCYAVSTGPDPLGPYYRYEFLRHYFPDYPRPAVWPDGYYIPTSTGDNRISDTIATQKHACVAEREKMLKGLPAAEQCVIIENVNFLNNADLDGRSLPPAGAPNPMLAAGGRQLDNILEDDEIFAWQFHVDWKDPSKTTISAPQAIAVAPYHYLCDGQLTDCVPQPGVDTRLDAQGDKIMARVVYRRLGGRESLVAVHSVNTTAGAGGVRWYELRVGRDRTLTLHQQGTYAPDSRFRWMASPAIDRFGNIGIGYSYGGPETFTGQRFAGRLSDDPLGQLPLRETVLVDGEGAQTGTRRWQDYTQTAVDPSDDCTIWYVGDYYKKDATNYSTKIGAFRMGACGR